MNFVKSINQSAKIFFVLFLSMTFSVASEAESKQKNISAKQEKVLTQEQQDFIEELATKYEMDPKKLTAWLSIAEKKQSIIDAMNRPAEGVMTWKRYRKIFMTEKRLEQGLVFWKKYEKEIQRAESEYGVPAEMIVAIIGIETFYGRIKGSYRVVDALYTLGFHYPKREKFFRSELGHFFRLVEQQKWQIETRKGSYAGAMGYGQFIPSSYISYAVDFDGDGFKDLIDNPIDAIGSVANYFRRHGWKTDEGVVNRAHLNHWSAAKLAGRSTKTKYTVSELSKKGVISSVPLDDNEKVSLMTFDQEDKKEYWLGLHNFYVISRYNHSHMYSLVAYQLSQQLKQKFKPTLHQKMDASKVEEVSP